MKPFSERIKSFPADQFIDWLCLACVDVRQVRTEEDAQEEINKIREAVTERLVALEQRAEAAEAKLAELEKQPPIGRVDRGEVSDNNEYLNARVVCLHDQADWENFQDGFTLYAEPRPAVLERKKLRDLVDVVWSDAAESPSYLSTEWADRLIDQIFPAAPEPRPAVPQGWEACSPEWIERNGECSCAEAPRIAFGNTGPHYHPAVFEGCQQQRFVVSDNAFRRGLNALNDCLDDCGDSEQGLRLAIRAIQGSDGGEIAE